MHDFVRTGVGGSGDRTRVGSASASHSQEVSQDVVGMVSRFLHMNMFRLLVEDRRSMFHGESTKLIHCVKKVTFNSSVVCVGNGASHANRINQRQQHINNDNKHDDGRIL